MAGEVASSASDLDSGLVLEVIMGYDYGVLVGKEEIPRVYHDSDSVMRNASYYGFGGLFL